MWMHRNRKPCNSFHGQHGLWHGSWACAANDYFAQHVGHTPINTCRSTEALQPWFSTYMYIYLILDIHVMVNWQLLKQGI